MEVEIYKLEFSLQKNANASRVLGEYFVKNNRNKGKLIINNKKFILNEVISLNIIKQNKVKVILIKKLYNKSCMFKDCESLKLISRVLIDNKIEEEENHENNIHREYNWSNNNINSIFYDKSGFSCSEINTKEK